MQTGAVILSGGRSTRMGRPKAWLELDGVTLLARVVETVARRCDRIVIVHAPGDALPPVREGVLFAEDPPDLTGGGPLVGLATGLTALEGVELAYVSSCDSALLSDAHVGFMLDALAADASLEAVVPEEDGQLHPLAGAVRVRPASIAAGSLLEEGVRSVRSLYRRLHTRTIPAGELPDREALRSCNTPEEWEALVAARGR